MSVKKRGLGRGLDALLSSSVGGGSEPETPSGDDLRELLLTQLVVGPHQPRRHFDDAALAELASSIKAQGVVQPIVVRPAAAGQFEIVAGERRWRAAKLAGLASIPAVVKTLDERAAMAVALVENLQRADLNPLEEAQALHRLIKECGLTHEKCGEALGLSRAQVSNLLRLTELNADVQQWVREGKVSLGHAKVLLGASGARQSSLAKLVAEQQLSVRQLEAMLKAAPGEKKPIIPPSKLAQDLSKRLGLPVRVQQSDKGAGKLTVSFKSQDELNQLIKVLPK